ncbi:benzyl alcohol o-benzoyltransferase, partial [Fagus crenata]
LLTTCLWRCRTIAIQPDQNKEVRILCLINARPKFNRLLPIGYYGNAFAISAAVTTTQKLCENSLGYALELEHMQLVADLMVIRGRPSFTMVRSYLVSNVTRAGFREVDFEWGKATYGGPAKGGLPFFPGVSFYIPSKNGLGEDGIIVPICLPTPTMERFVKELDGLLRDKTIVSSL